MHAFSTTCCCCRLHTYIYIHAHKYTYIHTQANTHTYRYTICIIFPLSHWRPSYRPAYISSYLALLRGRTGPPAPFDWLLFPLSDSLATSSSPPFILWSIIRGGRLGPGMSDSCVRPASQPAIHACIRDVQVCRYIGRWIDRYALLARGPCTSLVAAHGAPSHPLPSINVIARSLTT